MTDQELEAAAPWVKWRKPVAVHVAGNKAIYYACRYCIARHGLRGEDIPALPTKARVVRLHLATEHPRDDQPAS